MYYIGHFCNAEYNLYFLSLDILNYYVWNNELKIEKMFPVL